MLQTPIWVAIDLVQSIAGIHAKISLHVRLDRRAYKGALPTQR